MDANYNGPMGHRLIAMCIVVMELKMSDLRVPYTCGKVTLLWKTPLGEAWTFSYHDCWSVYHSDYAKTLDYYPTEAAAAAQMGQFVYNMNKTLFGLGVYK